MGSLLVKHVAQICTRLPLCLKHRLQTIARLFKANTKHHDWVMTTATGQRGFRSSPGGPVSSTVWGLFCSNTADLTILLIARFSGSVQVLLNTYWGLNLRPSNQKPNTLTTLSCHITPAEEDEEVMRSCDAPGYTTE